MKEQKEMNDEIEATLESFDGIRRAEAPAFFYTRVQARTARDADVSSRWSWIGKPAFSISVVAMLLLLNVIAITRYVNDQKSVDAAASSIERFANEYHLDNSSSSY